MRQKIWVPDLSQFRGPTYKALADAIGQGIAEGELAIGSRLPTHRALADALGVTVGTVTRGYAEAERRNLVQAKVGSGTYVRSEQDSARFFAIADEALLENNGIDLSFSIALSINQEQRVAKTMDEIRRDPVLMHRLLRYHPERGMAHQRRAGKRWLEICGIDDVDENRILISNGGQHGFFTALLSLCQRGDTVLCDGLTYPGFIIAARQLGLKVIGLDMDSEGATPEATQLACQRYQPRLAYFQSRLNNPTCRRMSQDRKAVLATLCRQHNVFIVEDDSLGCFADLTHATFLAIAPEISILVTSCSKAMTGGLRVGFIYAAEKIYELLAGGLRSSCWMASPLTAEVACRWIMSGEAETMLDTQRKEMAIRHQLVAEAFKDYRYEAVISSFNVWLHLPEQWRATAFADRAETEGVLIKPAEVFAAGQYPSPQAVRLCLGGDTTREQLQDGLERLSVLLKKIPAGEQRFD